MIFLMLWSELNLEKQGRDNFMQIKGNTQVELDGRGIITLRPSDHIASGGEGSVYGASNTVVKLYHDPLKVVQSGLVDKIQKLTSLRHPYIVAPQGLVLSKKGEPIGYYMERVGGYPLSLVFTNDFYLKPGFGSKEASILVHGMREVFEFSHSHGATLVDPNELNWNVLIPKKNKPEPRVFDVDSWAIGRWKPSVIMPSIRDWHSQSFDENSDWFSWGIVTFQVFTGIHPYKGTLDGFKMGALEERMKANASVFHPGVRLNRAVRDFSCIPGPLLDWYEAEFQKGERTKPPTPFNTGVTSPKPSKVLRTVVTDGACMLVYEKFLTPVNDPVVRIFHCGIALLASGTLFHLSKQRKIGEVESRDCEVVKVEGGFLIAQHNSKSSRFEYVNETSLEKSSLSLTLSIQGILSYENRMFAITENGLTEIVLHMFARPLLSTKETWGVMANSTRWWNGVGVQDAMGATYVVAPFGENTCAQIRVRELDKLKVVSAKSGTRYIAFVCVAKDGSYRKVELVLDQSYTAYSVTESLVDSPELNVAMLPKGVGATIVRDGEINIFVPTNKISNIVSDKQIGTDMALSNVGDRVVYIQNGELWSIRMK